MHYVFLAAHAEIAADGAGSGVAGVGGARHGPHHGNGVLALEAHHDDRRGRHGLDKRGEERTVNQMGVVLAQYLLAELHHLDAAYDKTFTLESGENVADKETADGGRFQDY